MYAPVPGTQLALQPEARGVSSDFLDGLRKAFLTGRKGTYPFSVDDLLVDVPDAVTRSLGRCSKNHPAIKPAAKAMFYFGHAARLGRMSRCRDVVRVAHCAMAQHALAEALLRMPKLTREVLHREGQGIGFGDADEWRAAYSGALAEARVAHLLLRVGMDVWLAPVGLDMQSKIDLIAQLPHTAEGLCVQIKSSHLDGKTTCKVFPRGLRHVERQHGVSNERRAYLTRFVIGVDDFSRGRTGVWQACYVEIGSKDVPFSELEACPTIQRPILESAMSALPSLARYVRVTSSLDT